MNNNLNKRLIEEIELMSSCNDSLERNIKIQSVIVVLFGIFALGFPLILFVFIAIR